VAEVSIPSSPIHTPPYGAIRTELMEPTQPVHEELLREAVAGVELGAYDEEILVWLSGWESTTVAVICSWLYRVREVER
jgi:hypothetical protein